MLVIVCSTSSLNSAPNSPPPDSSITKHHTVKMEGKEVKYQSVVGTILINASPGKKDDVEPEQEEKPLAEMFYVAYFKEEEKDLSKRPITFCFNGGPGSSSIWLHLGGFGPKKVALNEKGLPLLPYRLVENENSILELTDLVFVDAISTGYSRPEPGTKIKEIHSVDEDLISFQKFIRLFTTRFGRWESPKYLMGESYGATRAALLASKLHEDEFIDLDGMVLISAPLNYQTLDLVLPTSHEGNDLPYILSLPTYSVTAWYHQGLSQEIESKNLETVFKEAKEFAYKNYAEALLAGDAIEKEERKKIVQRLSYFTGIPEKDIEKQNLRLDHKFFQKELLKSQQKFIGRLDSRVVGLQTAQIPEDYDPSADLITAAFTATLQEYLRKELGWEKDDSYFTFLPLWKRWDWGKWGNNQYMYVGEALRNAMVENPHLSLFIAIGNYDLATPRETQVYSINHLNLDSNLKKNIRSEIYDSGHMIYLDNPSSIKLKADLVKYYTSDL